MNAHPAKLPLEWIENRRTSQAETCRALERLLPPGITGIARQLHRQLDGYHMSPLKSLSGLAALLGVGGIWVKDESQRLSLNSFKVLGGSFAIYQFLRKRLGIRDRELTVSELKSEKVRASSATSASRRPPTATTAGAWRGRRWNWVSAALCTSMSERPNPASRRSRNTTRR